MATQHLTGLLGAGISHSLSPQLHSSAYAAAGLAQGSYHYQLVDLERTGVDWQCPVALAAALRGLASSGFTGLNVTIPCKIAVVPHLDRVEASAAKVGAANVIAIERCSSGAGSRPLLVGHNTDMLGVRHALAEAGILKASGAEAESVALLGAGGIARAVLAVLEERGGIIEVRVFDADASRAAALVADFEGRTLKLVKAESIQAAVNGAQGVVNASPVGMAGFKVEKHGGMETWLADGPRWVADMVYNPAETPLVAAARSLGYKVASGDRVFLHQGAAAFDIMNPSLEADMKAMEKTLSGLLDAQTPARKLLGRGRVHGVAKQVSRVVFGCARLVQTPEPMELLDAIWAAGVNAFDLARSYGGGQSELILGQWLKSRAIDRKDIHLFTKGGAGSQATKWVAEVSADILEKELKESLAALDVPYVDCYMLHRDDDTKDVGPIVCYLSSLITRGFALSYGFSNWRFERVVAAANFAKANGLPPPAAVGPQFSFVQPARPVWPGSTFLTDRREAEWYSSNGIAVFCWEVLGKGMLANPTQWAEEEANAPRAADVPAIEAAVSEADLGTGDEYRAFRVKGAYITKDNFERRRLAQALAKELGISLAQVAVAYVLAQSPQFFAILGPRSSRLFEDRINNINNNDDDNNNKEHSALRRLPASAGAQCGASRRT